jgi:hypothetical protein
MRHREEGSAPPNLPETRVSLICGLCQKKFIARWWLTLHFVCCGIIPKDRAFTSGPRISLDDAPDELEIPRYA